MTRKRKNKANKTPTAVNISTCSNISSESEREECKGCRQEAPKIKRYSHTSWIECDVCHCWWHCECACVTPDEAKKYEKHKLRYTCALCVIESLPVDNEKQESSPGSERKEEERVVKKSDTFTQANARNGSVKPTTESKKTFITILDGIKDPSSYRESGKLKQEIQKHKPEVKICYAYSLSRGGFAIHTEDKEDQARLLKTWPLEAFGNSGNSIKAHSNDPVHRLVLRNVDTRLEESKIEEKIEIQTNLSVKAKRFKLRNSYKPIPIVLIQCDSSEDLEDLFKATIVLNSKKVKIENYRNKRKVPTRCYKCQEYAHIASMCKNSVKCETCSEQHDISNCTANKPKCANCKLDHAASSKTCPVYKEVLEKLCRRQ